MSLHLLLLNLQKPPYFSEDSESDKEVKPSYGGPFPGQSFNWPHRESDRCLVSPSIHSRAFPHFPTWLSSGELARPQSEAA